MKKLIKTVRIISAISVMLASIEGCFHIPGAKATGSIQISIGEKFLPGTRAGLPEIGEFILEVTDSKGGTVYYGSYSDSPDLLEVPAGSYTVSVLSTLKAGPAYDCPQYGDTQVVVVPEGQCVAVQMICTQLNSGLKVSVGESFRKQFPNANLLLRSKDEMLVYEYDETRIAYFEPGSVSIILEKDGGKETLFSRVLEPRQILSVNLSAAGSGSAAGVSIKLDSTRVWTGESYCYGGGGSRQDDALTVAEARERPGLEGVWVFGYIVGSFNSSSGPSFSGPFEKATNIVIAPRAGTTDKSLCLSVELPSGGHPRDDLNLKENPSMLGRGVYLRGNLVEAYYGIPGMKSTTDYQLK